MCEADPANTQHHMLRSSFVFLLGNFNQASAALEICLHSKPGGSLVNFYSGLLLGAPPQLIAKHTWHHLIMMTWMLPMDCPE